MSFLQQTYTLLHWKILALLIRLSDDSENLLYHQPLKLYNITYQNTKNVIDAHFHRDQLFMQDRIPVLPSYKWEHYSDIHVKFYLSMLIALVFPSRWKSNFDDFPWITDKIINATLGLHPKLAELEPKIKISSFLMVLKERVQKYRGKLIGIGECGLGVVKERKISNKQIQAFDFKLDLAKCEKLPIVIHCRGVNYVLRTCLNMMTKKLNREHHIHWHCFSGTMEDFLAIKGAFPNTKLESYRSL